MSDLLIAYPHGVWPVEDLEKEGSSGTGESISSRTGKSLFVPPRFTRFGTPIEEAVSALRSCVRKADLKFSLYWGAQLDLVGLSRTVWYTLIMMMFSDVGLAYPSAPSMAFDLYHLWLNSLKDVKQQEKDKVTSGPFAPFQSYMCPESRRILMSMITMACTFPKSRLVSHADSAQLLHNTGKLTEIDWAVKIGANRKLSNVMKPIRDNHTMAVSKAITCLTQYIVHQHESAMLRVADLLMEWGHTPVIWDVISNVCSHHEWLRWARYYHPRHERMWYWATGRAISNRPKHADIVFQVHFEDAFYMINTDKTGTSSSSSSQDALTVYNSIPTDWKSRHDQSLPFVSARIIAINCLLLIVRSNPGVMEGITPAQCTQYDETVDKYYSPCGVMNKAFQVPEEAKTFFTTEGKLNGRGFDFYWQESEDLVKETSFPDPYKETIFNGYISEENIHGLANCTNECIINRRISEPGYYDKGYNAENPLKTSTHTIKNNNNEDTASICSAGDTSSSSSFEASYSYNNTTGDDSSSENTQLRDTSNNINTDSKILEEEEEEFEETLNYLCPKVPSHLERQLKRFRGPKPGPPKDMDVETILGFNFNNKRTSVHISSRTSGPGADAISEEPDSKSPKTPPFLSAENTAAVMLLREKRLNKEEIIETEAIEPTVYTWKVRMRVEPKKRRKRRNKHRDEINPVQKKLRTYIVCGPLSIKQATRAVICNMLEQDIAPKVFTRKQKLFLKETFEEESQIHNCTENTRKKKKRKYHTDDTLKSKPSVYYLMVKRHKLSGDRDAAEKRKLFRWCEGGTLEQFNTVVTKEENDDIDDWLNLKYENDAASLLSKEEEEATVTSLFHRNNSSELLKWCKKCLNDVKNVMKSEIQNTSSDTNREALKILKTLQTRFEFLIKRNQR